MSNNIVGTADDALGEYLLVPDTVTQDEFSYGVRFVDVRSGQRRSQQISIQADADFLIHNQTQYSGGVTHSGRVIPNALVMLTDTGTGRKLFNEPVPIDCVFGSAQLPYILPLPKYLYARSILEVEITNVGDTIAEINLVFNGVKVFNKSNNN